MGTMRFWSETAADNATADATINWAEGQAPSTVNNSARAEMAAVATQYRVDQWAWCEKSSASCSVASQTVFRLGSSGGDVTSAFHSGRRVRLSGGSQLRYGTIASASYTSETTVTIAVDSGSLSASHNIVALGPSLTNSPVPGIGGAGTPWTLLADGAASGASYILDGIPAYFNWLRVTFSLRPATDGASLQGLVRKSAGTDITSYETAFLYTTGSANAGVNGTGQTVITVSSTTENTSPQGVAGGELLIKNLQSSDHKIVSHSCGFFNNSGAFEQVVGHVKANDTAAITGIKLIFSAGNITAGRVRVEAC